MIDVLLLVQLVFSEWLWYNGYSWRYLVVTLSKPCILVKANHSSGYSQVSVNGKQVYRHRLVLEQKLGRPIHPGMLACHHCDVRNCIESEHLYEGTYSTNHQDAWDRARIKRKLPKARTHCPNGHEYTLETTYLNRGRHCVICRRLKERKYNLRHR